MNPAFGTPTLAVLDNRSQPVRTLSYNSTAAGEPLDERIEHTIHDALGRVVSRCDARLFSAHATPNLTYTASLSGRALRSAGVDAGTQLALADVDGRPVWAHDARGIASTWTYDALGRPLTATETPAGGAPAVRDAWIYGEAEPDPTAHNLRGQCVRRYDPAGRLAWAGFCLTGEPLTETRTLLAVPDTAPDWAGDESAWATALESAAYPTAWTHDATGAWRTQTDAKGNVQARSVDVAGRLAASTLTLAGGSARPVLAALDYSAAGQILTETAGNGVLSTYGYEPETQRLVRLTVTRPVQTGRPAVLQNLHYAYDPVGNVTGMRDAAQATTYWRNQRVAPARAFTYDALYQLISATGRETVNRGQQGTTLPPATIPLPSDDTVYTNYTRTYTYDRGGNLTQIAHQGAVAYIQAIVVSATSNHALAQNAQGSLTPADVDAGAWFDAAGNQQNLLPDQTQPLAWNTRNRLSSVTLVQRGRGTNDRETYQYGADGMRVRRHATTQTSGTTRTAEAIYLPGLTLRLTRADDGQTVTVVEALHELRLDAGRTGARALHWETGLPAGLANDALRFSHGDLIGSVGLELDDHADLISREEYYPYGGTAVWAARSQVEADTKFIRYSGQERDATGLYDYGWRSYQPWLGRWLNPDPAGTVDGLNVYRMVDNNPIRLRDNFGLSPGKKKQNFLKRLFGKSRLDTASGSASAEPLPPETLLESAVTRPAAPEYKSTISMDPQYAGENNLGVLYFDEGAREKYATTIENGLIKYKLTGELVNEKSEELSGDYTDWSSNMMAYVIAPDNTMYVAKHETGVVHHSSFMSGADVRDAGMISIVNGQPLFFNAKSGHYKPSAEQKLASVDYFGEHGLDLSTVLVGPHPTSRFASIHHTTLYRANSLKLKGMAAAPRWAPTEKDCNSVLPPSDVRKRLKDITAWKRTNAH
ncbi:RHS repeat-associated core domain-containing protein [Burkholderia ubonensis]|uniref:RHS repeat-associated core domain-containing protein n=1 Tax=Burkholderia ubonensis TaxID=101571 RepID=UPI000B23EB23|nr:RHS repeat-associated core domain-containing protein [Burkholderia ubonensis]